MKSLRMLSTLLFCSAVSLFAADDEIPDVPERGGYGTITIKTDPEGSTVYLDAEEIGKTPIVKKKFRSGRFNLVIMERGMRQDIELVNVRFNVWPNKDNVYETQTRMPWGNIKLTTVPGKCQVMIDGDYADRTEGGTLTMHNLREGDHMIEINCGGANRADTLVRVTGEETLELHLDATKRRRR